MIRVNLWMNFLRTHTFLKLTINDRIGDVTEDYNLFLGDSYFEFWHYGQFADKTYFITYLNAKIICAWE